MVSVINHRRGRFFKRGNMKFINSIVIDNPFPGKKVSVTLTKDVYNDLMEIVGRQRKKSETIRKMVAYCLTLKRFNKLK